MGILDSLKNIDQSTAHGLLQMGLSMLQSKGNFGNALGQGGMAGIQGANQFKDREAQAKQRAMMDQLTQQQIASGQRQQKLDALPGQFYRMPSDPGVDATGGMETAAENPANASGPGGFDMQAYQNALMGMNPVQALQLQAMTRKAEPEIKSFKPGEVAGTFQGGKFNQLLAVPDAAKVDKPPSSIQEYQFAVGQGYKGTFDEWNKSTKRAGASNISMNANAEKEFSKDLGKAAAATLADSQGAAQAAQGSLANAESVRAAMKQGPVLLGPGAQTRQSLLRGGQMLGAGSKDAADTLSRTKAVEQGLAALELDAAQLMKGQGVISESERLILRKVSGGQIQDLTPGELDTALTAIERNARRRVDIHQQRVKQIPAGSAGGLAPFMDVPNTGEAVRRYNPATGKIE